ETAWPVDHAVSTSCLAMLKPLEPQHLLDLLNRDLTADRRDGIGQRNTLRAHAHAVLRVATVNHADRAGHHFQASVLEVLPAGVPLGQDGLPNVRGAVKP